MLSLRAHLNITRGYSNITQNMWKPILYGDEVSPPVRFVMVTAKLLGVEFDLHRIDLFKGENKTESYKKINPLQKVPAMSIDGNLVCDSHAIALYLCRSVHQQDLYPNDKTLQAKVDQLLFFNATTLFPIDSEIFSEFFSGKWPADQTLTNKWYSALDHLEHQLDQHEWLAGDQMQLCDICCATTLSSLGILVAPLERHANVKHWLKKLNEMSAFEVNKRGVERLQLFVDKQKGAIVK